MRRKNTVTSFKKLLFIYAAARPYKNYRYKASAILSNKSWAQATAHSVRDAKTVTACFDHNHSTPSRAQTW